MRGIPFQIVRESGALAYHCRCSVMWRQGIALYAKAGGVPWKLADTSDDVAFIGLSYALRSSGSGRFVTCCSQASMPMVRALSLSPTRLMKCASSAITPSSAAMT
jgi:hypothetical protein